jgi:hypothetical protein
MHIHARSRVVVLLTAALVVSACAGTAGKESGISSCSVGGTCKVVGTLKILRGVPASVAVLETEAGCVPIALPRNILENYERWNHRRVVVKGSGLTQPDAKEAVWFSLKDREVAAGGCNASPLIIYATQIRALR